MPAGLRRYSVHFLNYLGFLFVMLQRRLSVSKGLGGNIEELGQ